MNQQNPTDSAVNASDKSSDPAVLTENATSSGSAKQAIFLHTGWRSAGTWVWSRFRTQKSVNAFYEPLSTLIGDLSAADIASIRPVYSSGHPQLESAYYEEYRAFLRPETRGVPGYRKSFAIDRFGDQPDGEFPALQSYIGSLCAYSAQEGKIPVFKFCRSQGRTPWFKSAFPDAMHVGVLRNPASQFASGWSLKQKWQNPYFVAAPMLVLGLQQHEPIVKSVIEACGVKFPPVAATSYDTYAQACMQYAQTVEGVDAYRAFIALWILCTWRLLANVDTLVDIDLLGQSPAYAAELQAQFRTATHIAPDLSATRDLVDEAKGNVRQMSTIDGRLLRPINSAALKFLFSQKTLSSDPAQANIAETVRQKIVLANEISDAWRYY